MRPVRLIAVTSVRCGDFQQRVAEQRHLSARCRSDTRNHPSGPVTRISTPRSRRPSNTASRSSNGPKSAKFASVSATV